MDAATILGIITLFCAAAGGVTGAATWKTIGKIEGRNERIMERIEGHSDGIRELDRLAVKLEFLPEEFRKMKADNEEQHKKVQGAIEDLADMVGAKCSDCPLLKK